jgi:hypothetical protein
MLYFTTGISLNLLEIAILELPGQYRSALPGQIDEKVNNTGGIQ